MEQLTFNVMEVEGTIQGLQVAIQKIAETPPPLSPEEQEELNKQNSVLSKKLSELDEVEK